MRVAFVNFNTRGVDDTDSVKRWWAQLGREPWTGKEGVYSPALFRLPSPVRGWRKPRRLPGPPAKRPRVGETGGPLAVSYE
jgi:hypothetical protein